MIDGHLLEQRHAQDLENCVETLWKPQALLEDRDEAVDADGHPHLRLHRVGGRPVEGFDTQVLLDPLEKELHLPPRLVPLSNGERRQREVVGEEHEPLAGIGIGVADPSERQRVARGGLRSRQHDGLIAPDPRGLVDGVRVPADKLEVGLGPRDEEGPPCLESKEPAEIEVAAVQHVVCPRERDQHIEGLDVVQLAVGNVDNLRDVPAQIEQRVELDGPLGLTEPGPREERQTEIDRRRVEGVHRRCEVPPEGLGGIQRLGDRDEDLSEVGHDAPVPALVRIRQSAPRHAPPDAQVVQLRLQGAQTGLDVAETLAVGQLGKREAEELIETREAAHLVVALVAGHTAPKLGQRQEVHQLCKDRSTGMHGSLLG